MKKIFYCLMAATAAFAGSCTNEENVNTPQSDGTVSFQVSLPVNLGTRAYGDGLTATTLHYYVYDDSKGADAEPIVSSQPVTMSEKKTTININLSKGKTYSIVFWADAGEKSPYIYNETKRSISVNYENAKSQDENRDAFYSYKKNFSVGSTDTSITLKRPFAQINVGTTDFNDAISSGWTITETGLKVKNACTELSLIDGTVKATSNSEIEFTHMAFPTGAFPIESADPNIKYLSMNYIPIGKERINIDIKLTAFDGTSSKDIEYTNIPVQSNYRTNIYGSILTNSTKFIVTIDSEFAGTIDQQKDNTDNSGN